MADAKMLVFSNAVEGREDAFNEWYDTRHIPDVLQVPGVVAGRRFDQVPVPGQEGMAPAHRYLAIYDLDDDPEKVLTEFRARAAADTTADPLDKLHTAVELLFEFVRPDPTAHRPLFTEFAPKLLVSHPMDIRVAHGALFELFTDLMRALDAVGRLRPHTHPNRPAALTIQTVMFVGQFARADEEAHPITAEEVWALCAYGATTGRR